MPDEEPVDEVVDDVVDDTPVDTQDDAEAPPEETYTRAELTEMLGPRFAERYAGAHEGPEAFKKYAESFENTIRQVTKVGNNEPIDEQFYRDHGLEPPQQEQYVEEQAPLYGAPWAEPQSWDELVDLAQRNPRQAAEFALGREDLPNETKAWFFANWASVDAAGAFEYNQAATTAAAQRYADEQVAAIRAQVDPLVHDRMVANGRLMVTQAQQTIPGFTENGKLVSELLAERQTRDPAYHHWFLNATLEQQLSELRDLTGVAIYRSRPADEEAAQADLDATEADKTRVKTETSRTNGGRGGGAQSAMKTKNLADFKKLQEQGLL